MLAWLVLAAPITEGHPHRRSSCTAMRCKRYLRLLFGWLVVLPLSAAAQRIDSVQVFRWEPDGQQTANSAVRLVWRLFQEDAPHTTLKGEELATVNEAVKEYKPSREVPIALPDLAHVAMVFSHGRHVAFGVTEDLGRLIDLTHLGVYRIDTWSEHVYVRSLLAKLMLEH